MDCWHSPPIGLIFGHVALADCLQNEMDQWRVASIYTVRRWPCLCFVLALDYLSRLSCCTRWRQLQPRILYEDFWAFTFSYRCPRPLFFRWDTGGVSVYELEVLCSLGIRVGAMCFNAFIFWFWASLVAYAFSWTCIVLSEWHDMYITVTC